MKEKQFDDFIKHKLQQHEVAVPKGLWQKIAEQNNKKRYVGFWWKRTTVWLILACFVFSALVSANYINQVKGKHVAAHAIQKKLSLPDESAYLISIEPEAKQLQHISSNNTASANTQTPTTNTINNNVFVEKEQDNLTESKSKLHSLKVVSPLSYKNKLPQIQKPIQQTALQNIAYSSNMLNDEVTYFNPLSSFQKQLTQKISWQQMQVNNLAVLGKQKFTHTINDCPEIDKNKRNDWYIDGFTSAEYTLKKVQGNGNNTDYIQKKDSAERMAGGLTMGVRVSKNIGENLVLRAGLQFSQMAEKINLIRESDRRIVTVITIRTVTDAGGNTITVADTSSTLQVGYTTLTTKNYYRNIELPLSVGYELGNNKFKAQINGGVIVNVASWYNGKVLDSSYNLVTAANKENVTTHKHTVGLSLYGSVALIKPVTNKLEIFAEPYFRMNISKPALSAFGFTQQFSAIGIGIGARFKLNNPKE